VEMQAELPSEYLRLTEAELVTGGRRQGPAGESLCILGHHYSGTSGAVRGLRGRQPQALAGCAAQRKAKYVVFCGVHFMAESATSSRARAGGDPAEPERRLLDGRHGDEPAVATAMEELAVLGAGGRAHRLRQLDGRGEGAGRKGGRGLLHVQQRNETSSLGVEIGRTHFRRGNGVRPYFPCKVFAIPISTWPQHGRREWASPWRTAWFTTGPPSGGLSSDDARRARFFLWKGQSHPPGLPPRPRGGRPAAAARRLVIVHPECPREVSPSPTPSAARSRSSGAVARASRKRFAVGTESNLVERLARRHPDRACGRSRLPPSAANVLRGPAHSCGSWRTCWRRVVNQVRVDPPWPRTPASPSRENVEIPAGGR